MLIMMCYFYDDVDDDTVKLVDFGEFAVDGFIDVVDLVRVGRQYFLETRSVFLLNVCWSFCVWSYVLCICDAYILISKYKGYLQC